MPTQIIDYAGYSGCIALTNERVRVVLGPHCGGRVLEYALDGTNVLWLDPAQNGYVYDPQGPPPALLSPCGGRFDIGPEMIIPPHPELWLGRWSAEIVDDHTARMTSVESPSVGVQLVREFSLAPDSTRLSYMQTIINVSEGQTRWCHWSRTFGRGHGIAVVPLTPELSKYPRQYVMYGPGRAIQVAPEDPAICVQDGYLQVFDTPAYPKLGIDSHAGWFAYLTSDGLLSVRRWPTDPEQVYNELAGLTLSLWYFRDVVCELEPIGPMQVLAPGESAALTEEWWLTAHPFPEQRDSLDLARVAEAAQALMDS